MNCGPKTSLLLRVSLCVLTAAFTHACVKLPRDASLSARTERVAPGFEVGAGEVVFINSASARELEKLPGIGPALAARIVEHRTRYGPFRRAEHLMLVHGISERRFRQVRPFVRVE